MAQAASPASYDHVRASGGAFWGELRRLMEGGAKRFCDVGGGAKPMVPLERIKEFGLDYVILDESRTELDKAPAGYERCEASILDEQAVANVVRDRGPFEVAFSKWTAEHVPDGRRFHEQVYRMLGSGGTAVHFFPTLYSPPFVLNRVLPPSLSDVMLAGAQPERESKFRPHYSWCRGPSQKQIRRLESIGFTVKRYTGFFGHGYFMRVRPLHVANRQLTDWLFAHPLPSMTSFALVVLEKPAQSGAPG